LDFSNPQTVQNFISFFVIILGLVSILLNWRKPTQYSEAAPKYVLSETRNREQDESWQRLFQQSESKHERDIADYEREVNELTVKLAAKTAEVETLRALVDRLTHPPRDPVSINVSNQGQGAQAGQSALGEHIGQESKQK
jgi:hypothetical protein